MDVTKNVVLLFTTLALLHIVGAQQAGVIPSSDPYGYLGITRNPDGSITRSPSPTSPATADPANRVLTKDVPINKVTNTWARLYLPNNATSKLPLIIYFYGGGFVLGSANTVTYDELCQNIVLRTPAVVVSVNYRRAPEHRLPTPYDDALEALYWLKTTREEWLTKFADFSKCFLLGSSAGGNIAYHVGLRAAALAGELAPLRIRGLAMQQPFFGGVQRTPSEIRSANDSYFPQAVSDALWELALPVGADRDSKYSNPMKGFDVEVVDKVRDEGWRVFATGLDGDLMVDRQKAVAEMLKGRGVDVTELFVEGGNHGFDVDGAYATMFYQVFKNFVLNKNIYEKIHQASVNCEKFVKNFQFHNEL